ncbi:50S ribosomal protein L28 [Candidatus Saccharibacteria bacterium]|nr:50S ribosomal protein L28 [Candidatus Saccharibacteria bacterium]
MARTCEICGKGAQVGSKVAHSKSKSKKRFKVNLHTAYLKNGRRVKACASCIKRLKKEKPKG